MNKKTNSDNLSSTKFLKLLKYIHSIQALNAFSKYVHLQYRLTEKQMTKKVEINLFRYLRHCLKNNKKEGYLTWEVFKLDKYKNNNIPTFNKANVSFSLCKHAENFLIQYEIQNDTLLKNWLLWRSLQKENNEYKNTVAARLTKNIELDILDYQTHLNQFIALNFFMTSYNEECTKTEKPSKLNLLKAAYATKILNIQTQVNIEEELRQRKHILGEKNDAETIIKTTQNNYNELLINIYDASNTISATEFKAIISPYLDNTKVARNKKIRILLSALNKLYTIVISDNPQPFYENWNYIIEKAMKEKVLYFNNILPLQYYLNILSYAMIIGKDTVENIIQNYQKDLSPEYLEAGKLMGEIHKDFINGKFDEVIKTISVNDHIYRNSDFLTIKIFFFKVRANYEICGLENNLTSKQPLKNSIKSLKDFINKRKELKSTFIGTKNFISILQKIKNSKNIKDLVMLKESIATKNTAYKIWLRQKVDKKIKWLER